MTHRVIPYENQLHVGFSRNRPEPSAIELRFPCTFSGKAQRVLDFCDDDIFLFSYGGGFVATDQTMKLTRDSPADVSPYWTGSSLDDLEAYLEAMADICDDTPGDELPGWADAVPFTIPETKSGTAETDPAKTGPDRPIGDLTQAVMVKMDRRDGRVCIRTTDREHGRQVSLSLEEEVLEPLLRSTANSAVAVDGINFIELTRTRQNLLIWFTWLKHGGFGTVNGFRQTVTIPMRLMAEAFSGRKQLRYLYVPAAPGARVKFDRSLRTQNTIHRVVYGEQRIRRAFTKALRDFFGWPGEEVTLIGDGGYNFRFRTRSGYRDNGRLILNEDRDGGRFCYTLLC